MKAHNTDPHLRKLLCCSVEGIDVCLVVLFVVQLHDLRRNNWLQLTALSV